MSDIWDSPKLYDELIKVCHPDRFVNTDKQEIANHISQEISKYKSNSEMLIKLKEEAIVRLGIHIR